MSDVFCQSPAAPILLHSPYEPIVSVSAGVQRGWGNGNISSLNHWGVFGVADFTRYKFQIAVGITENENFQNTFSFNSGISFALGSKRGMWILQPALFTGFGYTDIYTSTSEKTEMINIPLGFSIGLDGPIPYGDINISLAPKIQYRYLNANLSENNIGGGVNIAIMYTPTGKRLGIRLGFDFLSIDGIAAGDGGTERSIIVGLEYLLN